MQSKAPPRWRSRLILCVLAIAAVFLMACGAAATTAPETGSSSEVAKPGALAIPATKGSDSSAPKASGSSAPKASGSSAPTAEPKPTAIPAAITSSRDNIIFATSEEPTTLGAASPYCGGNIQNTVCDDIASDPLTWIDDQNDFQVVGLTGIEGWEQLGPNRWQFKLRDNVKFHNGAPWNATQAKYWIDFFGDEETSGNFNSNDFSFHGVIGGEVVDDLTLDVVCGKACPILPRTTIFTKFQDVGWFESASEEEIELMTVGLGPYKIVEWRSGIEVELEIFEDYNPNPATVYSRAPTIQHVFQVWRNEPLVRAAMIQAGEADWAEIALEHRDMVPQWKSGTNNEVYVYAIDTVHHPELRKKDVREALALSVDCPLLMETVFDNLLECYGNVSQTGTVGITPENSADYGYDPARARELLEKANYNPDNEIVLNIRANRIPKDIEYGESIVTFWRDAGINAKLSVIDSAVRANISRSNCGHKRTREEFAAAAGDDLHEKCASLGPGAPIFSSMNLTESATSTESLDFSRQGILRNSCYSRSSGVCFSDHEEMINTANATPTGPERTRLMTLIADRVHNDFLIYGNFQVVQIYGMSEFLDWNPTYAPRIRANTFFYTQ